MKAVYKRAAEISHQDQNIGGVWLSHNLYRSTRVPGECAVGAVLHGSVPMAYPGGMAGDIQIPPLLILPSVNL